MRFQKQTSKSKQDEDISKLQVRDNQFEFLTFRVFNLEFLRPLLGFFLKIFQEDMSQLRRENERLKNELSHKSQICPTSLESSSIFPEWESFEFLTKKKGASGPSKIECLSYYSEKYDFSCNILYLLIIQVLTDTSLVWPQKASPIFARLFFRVRNKNKSFKTFDCLKLILRINKRS